jgi:hypothetical protein
LRDGLTQEEYDHAFLTYSACITEAGAHFIPAHPVKNSRGTRSFVVETDPLRSGEGEDSVDHNAVAAVKSCERDFFGAVQARWTAEHMPTRAETEAAVAGIAPCMEAAGIDMPEQLPPGWGSAYIGKPAPQGLRIDREAGLAFAVCSQEAAQKLGMAPGDGVMP